MKSSWDIITWTILLYFCFRVTHSVSTCEGQNGGVVEVSWEMAISTTGDARKPQPSADLAVRSALTPQPPFYVTLHGVSIAHHEKQSMH